MPNPFYWPGNEPDLLMPFQFVFAGAPSYPYAWLTQYWTRWLVQAGVAYSVTPEGQPGNTDYGTMDAWLLWASLGLYPVAGASPPVYALGSPVAANASIVLPALEAALVLGAAAPAGVSANDPPVPVLRVVAHNATWVAFPQAADARAERDAAAARAQALLARAVRDTGYSAAERASAQAGAARDGRSWSPSADPARRALWERVAELLAREAPEVLQRLAQARTGRRDRGLQAASLPPVTGNVYVARAAVNGRPLATPFVTHAQLFAGATWGQGALLEVWMTDTPPAQWAAE
jgi:hypothetical protein